LAIWQHFKQLLAVFSLCMHNVMGYLLPVKILASPFNSVTLHLSRSPPWTDLHQIWHGYRSRRH